MPNGKYVNSELEFEGLIKNLPDRQLLEFVARQNFETCIRSEKHDRRISSLESSSRKISGITGGITGTITAVLIGIINWFVGR